MIARPMGPGSGVARPREATAMAGQNGGPLVLGIDLGGTKVVAGVVDAEHRILGRAKRSTPAREGAAAFNSSGARGACALLFSFPA